MRAPSPTSPRWLPVLIGGLLVAAGDVTLAMSLWFPWTTAGIERLFQTIAVGVLGKASFDGGNHSNSNFRSDHPGGCNFLMADASVTFLNQEIDMAAYRARSTIAADDISTE